MSVFVPRVRILIEGVMPERALLRLKRAKIDLYNVKKIQKNQILLSVNEKDCEKVFDFFPNVCYNSNGYSAYVAKKVGLEGFAKYKRRMQQRIGLALGGLLSLALILFLDTFTFGVEFVGTSIYARESLAALQTAGIKPFSPYKSGKEDWICAQLLALDGVEYCSVKKQGLYARVEIRLSPFEKAELDKESMIAKRTGTLVGLAVLKGTPLKKVGEEVRAGDRLVENAFYTQSGEKTQVEPMARAVISCLFEAEIQAQDEQEAFAQAYLQLALSDGDRLVEKEITQGENDGLFFVKIAYTVIETINL